MMGKTCPLYTISLANRYAIKTSPVHDKNSLKKTWQCKYRCRTQCNVTQLWKCPPAAAFSRVRVCVKATVHVFCFQFGSLVSQLQVGNNKGKVSQ